MERFSFLILLLTLSASCSREKNRIIYSSFNHEIQLEGKRIGPIAYFVKPTQIFTKDSMLIVNDEGTKYFFSFIDINKGEIVGTYGCRGKGPKEFLLPDVACKYAQDKVLITDKAKFYSAVFDVDSMLYNKFYFPEKKVIFPPNLTIPYNVFLINDSILIGQTSSEACRFFQINLVNDNYSLVKSELKFKGSNKINRADLGQVLYSSIDYNYGYQKIVSSVRLFDQIDIYNKDTHKIEKSLQKKASKKIMYVYKGETLTEETVMYYIDVLATDKYIIGLYCGKSLKDAIPNVGNEIHIYNWNGEGLVKAQLNIGISKVLLYKGNLLIGIDQYDDQPLIIYDLKNVLE